MTSVKKAFGWKLIERFSVVLIQFALQLILARFLSPSEYGIFAILLIFTDFSSIIYNAGFSEALIQSNDVTDDDYSSVFTVSLIAAVIIYLIIFLTAPYIAVFFNQKLLSPTLRVISLIIFPNVYISVHQSMLNKNLNFKSIFYSNFSATLISGVISIALATRLGVWALVLKQVTHALIFSFVLRLENKWTPKLLIVKDKILNLFSFGSKVFISNLFEFFYNNLIGILIGRFFTVNILGLYNRANQFPTAAINVVNAPFVSLMLPMMSKAQDNKQEVKNIMKNSIKLSTYIMFPLMLSLALLSNQVIYFLLGAKWVESSKYLMILSIAYTIFPMQSANAQSILSVGRSDVLLRLNITKQVISMGLIIASIPFGPIVMACSQILSMIVALAINSYENNKLIHYSLFEQIKDVLPNLIIALVSVFIGYLLLNTLQTGVFIQLLLCCIVIVVVYLILSFIFKVYAFNYLLNIVKGRIAK